MTNKPRPKRQRWSVSISLSLLLLAVSARAADDPTELAAEALEANPSLEAMRARVSELERIAEAAGTWSDPMIGLDYLNTPVDSFELNDAPMSGVQINARQTLPPWGWSRLREEVADSKTATTRYAVQEAATQLRREVFALFFKLTQSRMLESVTQRHLARTDELLRAVRARYETARAGQHELLRLQVLRDRLNDDLADFGRADSELSAALARTLSRPAASRFETFAEIEPVAVQGDPNAWLALARSTRPELMRLVQSIQTEESATKLARVDGRPDVTVWAGYRVREINTATDSGTDFVSAGISVPIPWGSRKRSRAESAAHQEAARGKRAEYRAALDRIDSELTSVHARWSRAFDKAITYRDNLTHAAQAALDASFSNYRVGKADFATLYQAQVDLLNLERTLISAIVQTHIEAAIARATVGGPLDGGQS